MKSLEERRAAFIERCLNDPEIQQRVADSVERAARGDLGPPDPPHLLDERLQRVRAQMEREC